MPDNMSTASPTGNLAPLRPAPQRAGADVLRRLRRDRLAMVGAVVVFLLVLVALFAPVLAPYDPDRQFTAGLTVEGSPVGPNQYFWLGTDTLGRDLLSRLVYGARVSLVIGVLANGAAIFIGLVLGGIAGFYRGWPETIIMRFTDIMMAFPVLLLAVALVAILRPSLWLVAFVIALVYWTPIARVTYGQVLLIRTREFVEAARALGCTQLRILTRHVLPHLVPTVIVWGTLGIATNVLLEATLSYLGVGVQPPNPSWGLMITEGQTYFRSAPWMFFFPGVAILLTVLGFNLLGDGLRDVLDPKGRLR